ncbi:MAG: glycoside hydrolase family 13 protein [Clostridia bacterium]
MVFNSRDEQYKFPLGAVALGTDITYKLKFPATFNVSNVTFCIAKDREEFMYYRMEVSEFNSEEVVYTYVFKADLGVGPYWYHFKITTDLGDAYVSKHFGGEGKLIHEAYSFQQSVYDAEYKIPEWYGQGITYNIFPDRFNRTRVPRKIDERVVHKNWDDMPVYLPDEHGEVLNNDFFGGNLKGIIEKLDYLKSLNVSTIYLNPIFKAYSNHRYDTGDYKTIDKYVGTEKDFKELCKKAKELGMRIILDGVFSHTGYDSLYFNAKNTYDSVGAFNSKESPYYDWFTFEKWNEKYAAWWGIYTLPEVKEMNEKYLDYIIEGADSVINKWIGLGASGWRLDVADELPDEFIHKLNVTAKKKNPEAIVIGEVWEDASNKESYTDRRKYVYEQCLDSVMNYVFKDAIIHYMRNGYAQNFRESIEVLKENYPRDFFYSLMNIVGTHDTARILTTLVGDHFPEKSDRAVARLTPEQYEKGIKLLKLTSLIQYTMPGSPCLYYGDEVGVEGYEDPLNRTTYPWGKENAELLKWYIYLGQLRADNQCLIDGDINFLYAKDDIIAYSRDLNGKKVEIFINRSEEKKEFFINDEIFLLDGLDYKINII